MYDLSLGPARLGDAAALAAAVRRGERDPQGVIAAALDRLERAAHLNAALYVDRARALAAAERLAASIRAGRPPGALAGVPVVIKDNLADAGAPMTCGSLALAGYQPPRTAAALERLRAAGAIPIARANMDAFAMGSSGERSAWGPTLHPLDLRRSPGGSSSGCAALLAAAVAPIALGSDTGGSARQPAAFCGLVALKPTRGRISRAGLVPLACSMDAVAPMGRSAADVAALFQAIAGPDPADSTSLDAPGRPPRPLEGLQVGWIREAFMERGAVEAAVQQGLDALTSLGARVAPASLPALPSAAPAYRLLVAAEAASNMARYDGLRYGHRPPDAGSLEALYAGARERLGPEVKRRILLGSYALESGLVNGAERVRAALTAQLRSLLQQFDLLALPTAPEVAFPLGSRGPLEMYASDALTAPASLAGLPALSLPCGLAPAPDDPTTRLPVGLQLIGGPLEEATLLAAAEALEAALAGA